MEDIKNRKFTSCEQFLLGEKVKVIGGEYTGKKGVILHSYDTSSMINGYLTNESNHVYIRMQNNGTFNTGCNVLDLDIEDEQLYIQVKTDRFALYEAYQAYRVKEHLLIKERLKLKYKPILDVFDEAYGDQYDWSINTSNQLEALISFPEVTITNTNRKSHKIVDLYMKLTFKEDLKLYDMKGTRATVNYAEYLTKYQHSHMKPSDGHFYQWHSCCVGESEFAITKADLTTRFNANNLTRFLYQIPHYLSWESLEGVPYIKLQTIASTQGQPVNLDSRQIEKSYKDFIAYYESVPVKLTTDTLNVFNVENNSELEKLIVPIAGALVCNKVGTEYYLDATDSRNIQTECNNITKNIKDVVMFTFRGQEIRPKVITGEIQQNNNKVPYPSLTSGIANLLTKNINEYVTSERD